MPPSSTRNGGDNTAETTVLKADFEDGTLLPAQPWIQQGTAMDATVSVDSPGKDSIYAAYCKGTGHKIRVFMDAGHYSEQDKAVAEGVVRAWFNIPYWDPTKDASGNYVGYSMQLIDLIAYTSQNNYVWLGVFGLKRTSDSKQEVYIRQDIGPYSQVRGIIYKNYNVNSLVGTGYHLIEYYFKVGDGDGYLKVRIDKVDVIGWPGLTNNYYETEAAEQRPILGLLRGIAGNTVMSLPDVYAEVAVDDFEIASVSNGVPPPPPIPSYALVLMLGVPIGLILWKLLR